MSNTNTNSIDLIIRAIIEGQEDVTALAKELERLGKTSSQVNRDSVKESKDKATAEKSSSAEIITASTNVINTLINGLKEVTAQREAATQATAEQAEAETLLGQVTGLLTAGTQKQAEANESQNTSLLQLVTVTRLLFAGYQSYSSETGILNKSMKILTQSFDENATTADKANKVIADFKELFKEFSGSTSKATTAFEKFKELLGPVGTAISTVSSALGISEVALVGLGAALLATVAAIAAVIAVSAKAAAAFAGLVKETNELSNSTGINTEITLAASKAFESAGLSAEDYRESLNGLLDKVTEAKNGNDELRETLEKEFGITAFDNASLAVEQFNNTIQGISLESEKGRKAIEIFGRDTAGFFKVGGKEIENFRQQFRDAGLVIDKNSVLISEKLTSGFKRASLAIETLFASLGKDLVNNIAPGITELTNEFEKFLVSLAKSKDLRVFFRSIAEEAGGLVNILVEVKKAFDDSAISFTEALSPLILLNRVVGDLTETLSGARKGLVEFFLPFKEIIDLLNSGKKAYEEQIRIQRELEEANAKIAKSNSLVAASVSATISAFDDTKKAIRELVNIDTEASEKLIKNAEKRLAEVATKVRKGTLQEEQAKEERIKIFEELVQKEIGLLKDRASEQAAIEKNSAEKSIESIKNAYSQGTISAEEQARQINAINQASIERQIESQLNLVNSIREFRRQGFDVVKELTQAEIELESTKTKSVQLNGQARDTIIAGGLQRQKQLLADLKRDQDKFLFEELQKVEELEKKKLITYEEAVKKRIELEKGALNSDIEGINLLLQNTKLSEEQRTELLNQRKDLVLELSKLEIESSGRVRDAQLADEQDVLDAKRARLDGEQTETERLIKQRIDLLRSAGASELEIAQLVDRAKKEALSKEIALINDRISLAQKDGSSQAEIQDLLNDRKQLENEIQDIIKGRTGAVASELNALAKGLQAADREFAGLVSRSDEFLQRSRSISDQLTAIAKEFEVTFDSDKATDTNLIEAQKQLEQFQKRLAETNQDLLTGSGIANSLLLAQKQTIEQAIDDLTNRVQVAQSRLAAEAAAERALQEEQKQRETQQKLISLYQEYLGERSELDEDYAEQKAALEKEIATLQFQSGIDLAAFQQMQQKALTEFDAKQAAEREKRAEQERLKKEDEAQKTVDNIKSINRKAREEEANERLKFLEERAKLEEQLASAEAAKSKAGSSSELAEAQAQIDKIKSDLTKLDGEEKARRERAKKRDEEIAKAQQAAQEKLKGAKTKEEIDAINEELEAVTKGINDRFKIEEDKFKKLKDLQGKATKETLRLIAEEFENKKKIAEEEEAALIESIRRKAAQQAAALAAQAEADRMAAEKARQDFIDRQNQEFNDRKKAYEDKLNQLKEALDKEKKEYKEQSRQIEEEYKKSLSAINSTLQGLGNGVNQLFDDLLKKAGVTQEAINKIIASFPSGGNSSSSSSSSSSSNSTSSNNNSGNGNVFSSPNQGDNNGNAGSIGFNIQQAPNQDNQGGQQGQQNSPASPPTSPSGNQSNSNSNTNTGNAGNTGISSSPNQANQNSQLEPTGGQIDDTVPDKLATAEAYKTRMLKLHKNLLDSFGITDLDKPGCGDVFLKKRGKEALNQVKSIGTRITARYANIILDGNSQLDGEAKSKALNYITTSANFLIYIIITINFAKEGNFATLGGSRKNFEKGVDFLISLIDQYKAKPSSKFNGGLDDAANPTVGGNPGDVNASPNQPGGGRGDNPSPRGPGSSNPVTPTVPNGGGLSDKERAVFAGRDRDAISGPGEGASAAGYVDPRTGRTTPDSTSPTIPSSSSEPSLSQMSMNMTQSNQIKNDFNIQITGLLSDPRTLSEIEEIVNRGIQAYGQQIQQEIRSQLNGMQFSS
ncbi:MAG: hypothetical protein WAQ98_11025 [Blastocatellia bacterium]